METLTQGCLRPNPDFRSAYEIVCLQGWCGSRYTRKRRRGIEAGMQYIPKKRVAIIGGGINGMVAANYLARGGFEVTIIERKGQPGGACCSEIVTIDDVRYEYPQGASVLGMMQDFVFHQTGLAQKIKIHVPAHPSIFRFKNGKTGYLYDEPEKFAREMHNKFHEKGYSGKFLIDLNQVVEFLQKGYRDAAVPTVESAENTLGKELTARWITGSARNLLDYYFTAEESKIIFGISVVESGPVSFDSPYSAFSIPLMSSGSIFGGSWGYVQGGIWQIPLALDAINAELGVKRIFNTQVTSLNDDMVREVDYVIFATDPLTAARVARERAIEEKILGQKMRGTGGKLVMLFRKQIQWKGDTGNAEFGQAIWNLPQVSTLNEYEERIRAAAQGADFSPCNIEIYSEGVADRFMGGDRPYDIVSVYLGALGLNSVGADLPGVKRQITDLVLAEVENPEDLIDTILETPRDLMNLFYFPGGNIDHMELTEGQTFYDRTYSTDPANDFYRFGSNPRLFYCGAGAYPCGTVAGTGGYMCAKRIIRKDS
jgi:phytoene dehydrogenase-like protein